MQHLRQAPAMGNRSEEVPSKPHKWSLETQPRSEVLGLRERRGQERNPVGAQAAGQPLITKTEMRFGFFLCSPLIALFRIILTT